MFQQRILIEYASDDNIYGYSNLEEVITDIPNFSENSDIKGIYCGSFNLTSLPNLPPNLKELHSTNNNINKISYFPSNLEVINLHDNSLEYLPPIPEKVTNLILAGNPLKEIPVISYSLFFNMSTRVNLSRIPEYNPSFDNDNLCIENEINKFIGFNLSIKDLIEHIIQKFTKKCYECEQDYVTDNDAFLYSTKVDSEYRTFKFRLGRCKQCSFLPSNYKFSSNKALRYGDLINIKNGSFYYYR